MIDIPVPRKRLSGMEHLAEQGLGRLVRQRQQVVAGLDHGVAARDEVLLAAQDGDDDGVVGNRQIADRSAVGGGSVADMDGSTASCGWSRRSGRP